MLPDGTHIVCEVSLNAILKLDNNGKILKQLTSTCGEFPLRLPNDLTLERNGGVYFTDSGEEDKNQLLNDKGRIGYVDTEGSSHFVADCEGIPNGIVISNDNITLYVAISFKNEISSYSITAPGKVGVSKLFAKLSEAQEGEWLGPDGIAVNIEGKIYVTQFGVGKEFELNPRGDLIRSISAGHQNRTNIAFSGENDKLYRSQDHQEK